MGTIVEFYTAQSHGYAATPTQRHSRTLVESLSINSHMVEWMLNALAGTTLGFLVGDGSDPDRSVFVSLSDLPRLRAQSVTWMLQPDEVSREIYEAVNDGIDEAVWANCGLLVVVR